MSMTRKKLFFTLGVASGTAALVGSGAFSSVQAERSVSVEVVGDKSALLALQPTQGPSGQYASISNNGMLEVDVSEDNKNVRGEGVNLDSIVNLGEVFKITNQGTQSVGVWIEHDSEYVSFRTNDQPLDNDTRPVRIGQGESLSVRIIVNTYGYDGNDESLLDEITIHAEADAEQDAPSVPAMSATRSLSRTQIRSGESTVVTLSISVPNTMSLDIFERFDTRLGESSLSEIEREGENLPPSFVDLSTGGGIILFNAVEPGKVEIQYSIQTTAGTPPNEYEIGPNVLLANGRSVVVSGEKTVEVTQ